MSAKNLERLDKYLSKISTEELVAALARNERLGYDTTDCDDGKNE